MGSRIARMLIALSIAALAAATGSVGTAHAAVTVRLVCPTGAHDYPGTTGPALNCPAGAYTSIQAAVADAQSGDWILVAPGIYHEKGATGVGVTITTANLHIRGMDRNGVVVDGTLDNSHGACSTLAADQDTTGRDGIVARKASGTAIENLTACNFLGGTNAQGNEIWWNSGDGSGLTRTDSYRGDYITGTTTFFSVGNMAKYGIFVSNSNGPGVISHAYAANMADSAFYVGACADCNATLDHVHAENSALGYSGTNAGGHLLIENSEWDRNKAGIVPNSLNNDDAPPPQDGGCPGSATVSCTLITHNNVHDNNNPNIPTSGVAGAAPIGTGIELSGASFDTVDNNRVHDQGSWGILVHDYPDTETPPGVSQCQGGVQATPALCLFRAQGDVISNNVLNDNGGFGNPTNGDLASEASAPNPRDCFFGNSDPKTAGHIPTSDPPNIQDPAVDGPPCASAVPGTGDSTLLAAELVCASGAYVPCTGIPVGQHGYPQTTTVTLLPLTRQTTMPNPCAGVPDNPWCSNGVLVGGPPSGAPEAPLALLLPVAAAAAVLLGIGGTQRRLRVRRT